MFKEANREDLQFLNKEFCESKNLFFALASGMLDKKVKQQKAALKAKEQQEKERQKRQREYEALLDKHHEMGIQISEDGKTLYKFPKISTITDYEIPEGIVFINPMAFFNCSHLLSVKIPSSVKVIGLNAFRDCLNLCNVDFSNGLERIECGAFMNCASIHRLDLPNTLLSIDVSAFADCTSLEDIYLPKSFKRFEDHVFSRCIKLSKIFLPASIHSLVLQSDLDLDMSKVKIITTERCPKCNAMRKEGKKFCTKCGYRFPD